MIYSVPKSQFDGFIRTGIKPIMAANLANAIVRLFGGYEDFSFNYYAVTLQGLKDLNLSMLSNPQIMIDFFGSYNNEILSFVADMGKRKQYESISDFVAAFEGVKETLSSKDAYEGIYNKESPHRNLVARAIVIWVVESLCDDYYDYMCENIGITF